jgi:hypothetical protein
MMTVERLLGPSPHCMAPGDVLEKRQPNTCGAPASYLVAGVPLCQIHAALVVLDQMTSGKPEVRFKASRVGR